MVPSSTAQAVLGLGAGVGVGVWAPVVSGSGARQQRAAPEISRNATQRFSMGTPPWARELKGSAELCGGPEGPRKDSRKLVRLEDRFTSYEEPLSSSNASKSSCL